MAIFKILQILINKIRNQKIDFLLCYKYFKIQRSYGKKCLDIGSGSGRFAKFLWSKGHNVNAIDVVNKSEHPEIDLTIFDGKSIPFKDKEFETSILMFVLHHTDYTKELLKECIRVTSKRIIIGEDIMVNTLDRILGNIHLGTSPWSKSRNGFKTDKGWQRLFVKNNLKLVKTVTISRCAYPVYPVQRKIYVLESVNVSSQ